jgi:hypothetical protein
MASGAGLYILAIPITFFSEWAAFVIYLISIILFAVNWGFIDKKLGFKFKFPVVDSIIVLVILLSTFFLYFFNLESMPQKFDGAEAIYALRIQSLVDIMHLDWVFAPGLFIPILQQTIFNNLGVTVFALRITSLILAVASIAFFYFWANLLFSRKIAIIASVIFAFSHIFIELARISVPYTSGLFIFILTMFLLTLGLKRNSYLFFFLAGVSSAFSLFLYENAKGIIIIPILYLVILFFQSEEMRSRLLRQSGVFILGFVLLFLPMLIKHGDLVISLINPAPIFSPNDYQHMQGVYKTSNPIVILVESAIITLKSFNSGADNNSLYGNNKSLLDFVSGIFFALGLFILFYNFKDNRNQLLIISFVLLALFGSVLMVDPPRYPEMGILLPVAALVVGMSMVKFTDMIIEILDYTALSQGIAIFLLVVLSLLVGFLNVNIYFNYYIKNNIAESSYNVPTLVGNYINTMSDFYQIYIVGFKGDKEKFNVNYETVKFLSHGKSFTILGDVQSELPLKEKTSKDAAFIFFSYNFNKSLPFFKGVYPMGREEIINNNLNIPVLGIYKVTYREINSK